jgi:exportin-1
MFTETLTTVSNVIPLSLDLKETYARSNGRDQEFVANLALFLSSFFSAHLDVGFADCPFPLSVFDRRFFGERY